MTLKFSDYAPSVCRRSGSPLKTSLMDLLDRRFLFVVGKGGVGKTTVATGLALAASRRDKKVLRGRLHFVLPTGIGETAIVDDVSESEIIKALSTIGVKKRRE